MTPPDAARLLFPTAGQVSAADRAMRYHTDPRTIWLTGLSASGKTTLAIALERHLFESGRAIARLDGDNLRTGLSAGLGFSAEDRTENVRRAACAARLFNEAGLMCVVALISPRREMRAMAADIIGAERFALVHVSTPLSVCAARDPKGLYKKAMRGELDRFTGVSAPYDEPAAPLTRVDASRHTVAEGVAQVVEALSARFSATTTTG